MDDVYGCLSVRWQTELVINKIESDWKPPSEGFKAIFGNSFLIVVDPLFKNK